MAWHYSNRVNFFNGFLFSARLIATFRFGFPPPAPSRQWYLFIEVFSLCHHEGAILRHEDGFVLDFICFFQKKFSVIYWCVLFDMRRVSHGKICLVGEKVSSKKLTFPWDASCQSGCEGKSEKAFQDRGHNGLLRVEIVILSKEKRLRMVESLCQDCQQLRWSFMDEA